MEKVPTSRPEQLALAAQWLNQRMAGNPAWRPSMPSARTTVARDRRTFIAWQLIDGKPHILDALLVEDVSASFTAGLAVHLVSKTTAAKMVVSSHPREIIPGVFVWIPLFADVRFGPLTTASSVWALSVPMCTRATTDRADHPRLSTLKEFCALWPNVSV